MSAKRIALAIGAVVVLWLGLPLLVGVMFSDGGKVGDMFGIANALFSGLAFAGVILTLYHQNKESRENQAAVQEQIRLVQEQVKILSLMYYKDMPPDLEFIKAEEDGPSVACYFLYKGGSFTIRQSYLHSIARLRTPKNYSFLSLATEAFILETNKLPEKGTIEVSMIIDNHNRQSWTATLVYDCVQRKAEVTLIPVNPRSV